MGINITTRFISIESAPTARAALSEAISEWRDQEAGRWDDERSGSFPTDVPLMTKESAERLISFSDYRVTDGQSVVIPVCSPDDVVTTTKKVSFPVTGEQLRHLRGNGWGLYGMARRDYGDTVVGATLVSLPKPRKPRATATEGKAVTRYYFVSPRGWSKTGYATMAEARTAGTAYMDENPDVSELTVEAIVVREGGSRPLVKIERPEPENSRVNAEITMVAPKAGAAQVGWAVAFAYHS